MHQTAAHKCTLFTRVQIFIQLVLRFIFGNVISKVKPDVSLPKFMSCIPVEILYSSYSNDGKCERSFDKTRFTVDHTKKCLN